MATTPNSKKSSFEEGSLDQYLRDISIYPLITREDEVALAQRIRVGRPGGARQARALEPALRRQRREEVPEPGRVALRPDQRGQPRPDPRGAQVRRDEGDQVHLLRRVVDPPGDPPGAGRAEPHRARAAQPRRHAAPHRQARELPPPGARPRGDARRDRRGDGHHGGGGREDDVDLADPPLARCADDAGRGQPAARLPPRQRSTRRPTSRRSRRR